MRASAGVMDSCRKSVAGLPVLDCVAFILVQHLDPTHESMMVGLLAGHTTMTVIFFFKQKTAYEIGLGIPAEPLFRSKLAPSVCRMTFPILASLLVRLVVLLPFQLLRLSLATPSRWTPLALSVFLHCVVALLLTLL